MQKKKIFTENVLLLNCITWLDFKKDRGDKCHVYDIQLSFRWTQGGSNETCKTCFVSLYVTSGPQIYHILTPKDLLTQFSKKWFNLNFFFFFFNICSTSEFSSSTHQQSDFITTEARCSFLFQLSWPSFQDRKLLFDNCTALHVSSHLVRRFRDVSAEAKGKKERKKNKYVCAMSLPSVWVAQGPLSLSLLRLTTITLVTYHN